METPDEHFPNILLYYFNKGRTADQAHEKICDVYGKDVLTEEECSNWFLKFSSGEFGVINAPHIPELVESDAQKLKSLVKTNSNLTIQEIAKMLNMSHAKVINYLKRLDLKLLKKGKRLNKPHLSKNNDLQKQKVNNKKSEQILKINLRSNSGRKLSKRKTRP